jgi:hypothetical protein
LASQHLPAAFLSVPRFILDPTSDTLITAQWFTMAERFQGAGAALALNLCDNRSSLGTEN